jgi:hypothetical protein
MRIGGWCLLVGVAGVMAGCSDLLGCGGVACGALPPAITFRVHDALDGGAVPGARINGFPCPSLCTGQRPDGGVIEQAGTFEFSADAPGYQNYQFELVVPAAVPVAGQCCGLPFVPQQLDFPLMPL